MPAWTIRNTSPAGSYLPYYMQTASGGYNNAIYGNGAIAGADVLNNCVGYSVGRCAEITEELNPGTITSAASNPYNVFAAYNAQDWYQQAINNGFNVGQQPAVGAVGVWYSAQQNVGHVANIEDYVNGVYEISESHYNYPGGNGSWDYSYLQAGPQYLPAFIGNDTTWSLIGFIYPDYSGQPGPGTPGRRAAWYRHRRRII